MKQLSKPSVLTAICALGGFLCLLLRQWLFATGLNERGLLEPGHPGNWLSWVLTGAVSLLLIFLFFTWKDKHVTCSFPLSPLSGAASLFLACGYGIAAWNLLAAFLSSDTQIAGTSPLLDCIAGALAVLCILCTLLIALGQFRGQRMHPLLHCPGILFFACYLIHCYSLWSGEPQLQLFFFQMMAIIFFMITVFCRAELAAGKISGRNYLLFSRAAIFMSIAAVSHSSEPLLYLFFALALLPDGCSTWKKEPKPGE